MAARLSDKPVVVLDWGWIRQRKSSYLPNRYHYLVPEDCISEVVGADEDPTRFADKLRRVFALNSERVFIGREVRQLIGLEETPGVTIGLDQVAFERVAELDFNNILFDRNAWKDRAKVVAAELDTLLRPKVSYDEYRREYGSILRAKVKERESNTGEPMDWEQLKRDVCEPRIIEHFLRRYFPQFSTPEWLDVLCVFPDRHAIGRFVRLSLWQLVRTGTIHSEKKLRNDWEDTQYGLLASYASEFWTRDEDLAIAVKQLFPSVQVNYEVLH